MERQNSLDDKQSSSFNDKLAQWEYRADMTGRRKLSPGNCVSDKSLIILTKYH